MSINSRFGKHLHACILFLICIRQFLYSGRSNQVKYSCQNVINGTTFLIEHAFIVFNSILPVRDILPSET